MSALRLHLNSIIPMAGAMGFLFIGLHFQTFMVILLSGVLLGYALIIHAWNMALIHRERDLVSYSEKSRRYEPRINR